jgi:hypothetical protein
VSTPSKRAAESPFGLSAAVCNDHPTSPRHIGPSHAEPGPTESYLAQSTPQREQQGEPKFSVLPSATVASPNRNLPHFAMPDLTGASRIHSPKRAAGRAQALRAAVCSYSRILPYRAPPRHTTRRHGGPCWDLHQRMPSTIRLLQRACDSKLR